MSAPDSVFGMSGRRYPLGDLLGRGGQGAVFTVEGERLAVKLLTRARGVNKERLRDQMAMVSRLPIEDLPIAKPLERLRLPFVGYVMELFTGMVPFQRLMRPPRDVGSVLQWYLDGGGLGRRLRLLAKVAGILSRLHSKGLIYVDLSPANVFVSEDPSHNEIRLIDTDNLRSTATSGRTFYTPSYGAPELVLNKADPDTLSDAYAFAVLCFETLSLLHPFKGDHIVYGEPELEEQAFAGQMPWVDHSSDNLNRASDGIPRALVLTRDLKTSFQQMFEEGLHDRSKRPGLAQWSEHLHEAADRVITCPSCGGGYYFNQPSCPWCDEARPPFVIAAVHQWDPNRRAHGGDGELIQRPGLTQKGGKQKLLGLRVASMGSVVEVSRRLTHGMANDGEPALQLVLDDGALEVTKLTEGLFLKGLPQSPRTWRVGQTVRLSARRHETITIHMGEMDELHRVVLLDFKQARGQ